MGITRVRPRASRRPVAVLGAVVALLAVGAALAAPAGAASEATFDDIVDGSHATVRGDLGAFPAGLMGMTIDGASGATGYCIDIGTEIMPGESGLAEVDWDTSGVPNLDVVGRVLANYHPNGSGPAGYEITGTDAQRAAATQAAIWHVTDGFDLTVGDNDPVIEANYAAILAAIDAGALPASGQPDVSLAITPPASTTGEAGQPVGPYVVATTASAVTLTPSAGLTVTDADGVPLAGPVTDGTEFFLVRDAEGAGSVSATADATVHAGRVFVKAGSQRLILATSVDTTVDVEVSASWTPPPPEETTTTTAPPETTAPPQTTTTVGEQPTTTVSIVPDVSVVPGAPTPAPVEATTSTEATGGSLPRTGNDVRPLVAAGVALLGAGLVLGVAARRRRA